MLERRGGAGREMRIVESSSSSSSFGECNVYTCSMTYLRITDFIFRVPRSTFARFSSAASLLSRNPSPAAPAK